MIRALAGSLALAVPALAQEFPAAPQPAEEPGRITRLVLDAVPLAEAVRRVSAATGVPIELTAAATTRVSLELHDAGFWDAVLELCRRGGADLLPDDGRGVRLLPGTELSAPFRAAGPLLLRVHVKELERQRAGELAVTLRPMPGYTILSQAPLRFANGKDDEG